MCSNPLKFALAVYSIWNFTNGIVLPISPLLAKLDIENKIKLFDVTKIATDINFEKQKFPSHLNFINIHAPLTNNKNKNKTNPDKIRLQRNRGDPALIIPTSGTTGTQKGVVYNLTKLQNQSLSMAECWSLSENDHFLNMLPLNHIHGFVNNFFLPLFYLNAKITFTEKFNPKMFIETILEFGTINVFMGVPTMYSQIVSYYKKLEKDKKKELSERLSKFKIFLCGSAPLSEKTENEWSSISRKPLVQRFGMSECGMVLSNDPKNVAKKSVGVQMPKIRAKLDQNGIRCVGKPNVGELLVKSENIFEEYYKNGEKTKMSFKDGWFKTGDIFKFDDKRKVFLYLGRKNVDFVQINGFKVSLMEVEKLIVSSNLAEEALIAKRSKNGVDYLECFLVKNSESKNFEEDLIKLKKWLKKNVSGHMIPRKINFVKEIKKNALGKIERSFYNK